MLFPWSGECTYYIKMQAAADIGASSFGGPSSNVIVGT